MATKKTLFKNCFLKSVLIRINYYIVVWQLYISYWYITLRINLLIWCQFDVKFNLNLCKPFIYELYLSNCFIVGTFSDAIPKPLIFLSNSLLCFFQPDKKPCLPLKLITFRISSCIIWCIWCKSRLREWVLQSDCLLNYNLYYWISQSDQKKQRTNFHFKVRHFFLRYWIIKVFIQSIKLGSF